MKATPQFVSPMKIGIHGKEFDRQSVAFIELIFEILTQNKAELFVSTKFDRHLKTSVFERFRWKTYEAGESLKKLDAYLSIGGDGTLLSAVTHIGKSETPILGINTGRLGFLATISREETEHALQKLFQQEYTLDRRSMLRLESNKKLFGDLNFAT